MRPITIEMIAVRIMAGSVIASVGPTPAASSSPPCLPCLSQLSVSKPNAERFSPSPNRKITYCWKKSLSSPTASSNLVSSSWVAFFPT
jgi:hypothetical protein